MRIRLRLLGTGRPNHVCVWTKPFVSLVVFFRITCPLAICILEALTLSLLHSSLVIVLHEQRIRQRHQSRRCVKSAAFGMGLVHRFQGQAHGKWPALGRRYLELLTMRIPRMALKLFKYESVAKFKRTFRQTVLLALTRWAFLDWKIAWQHNLI